MAQQTQPTSLWFDARLVMRVSPIQGSGIFATEHIHRGERLMRVSGGIVYSSEDWRTGKVQLDSTKYNEARIGDDLFVATPIAMHYYVNHSCDPNIANDNALHDIQAGEEITIDYAFGEANPAFRLEPCHCGSPLSRGQVTGNDWMLPELQKRYQGLFTTFVEQLIQKHNPQDVIPN
jgi:SET domain-containing protein